MSESRGRFLRFTNPTDGVELIFELEENGALKIDIADRRRGNIATIEANEVGARKIEAWLARELANVAESRALDGR